MQQGTEVREVKLLKTYTEISVHKFSYFYYTNMAYTGSALHYLCMFKHRLHM